MGYQNFQLAIYFTVQSLKQIQDFQKFTRDFEWFQKHLQVGKVYLETYRSGIMIEKEQMLRIQSFFKDKGILIAGGITTTTNQGPTPFKTLCYSNQEHKEKLKEVVEFTAALFDEIILDDFYFTSCKCPDCIHAKGKRSWDEFRIELMRQVTDELVLKPAKEVNPQCKVIIKYPNWYEHYQFTGYDLEEIAQSFDGIYGGTETRDPRYTQQNLPGYLSYSLPQYLKKIRLGQYGGGWFDFYDCFGNLNYYVEQGYLTLFAKVREVTLFCFSGLLDTIFVPMVGYAFTKTDRFLGELGNPVGVSCYKPFHSTGEDFLPEYLGMTGIPIDLTPSFPEDTNAVLLTADAAHDSQIIEKIKRFLLNGKTIVITSGLLKALRDRGFEEIAQWWLSGRSTSVQQFAIEMKDCGFRSMSSTPQFIQFPVIEYGTNDSWPLAVGIHGEQSAPVLLETTYGRGRLILLAVPDNYSDLYLLPDPVLTVLRQLFFDGLQVSLQGPAKIGLFLYDNRHFILESFLPYNQDVSILVSENNCRLQDLETGQSLDGEKEGNSTRFSFNLRPAAYRAFKVIR